MFKKGEVVCALNRFGTYDSFVLKEILEDGCLLEDINTGEEKREKTKNLSKHSDVIALLEHQIAECYAMIDHFIKLKDQTEISSWRRYLQAAKLQKRRLRVT